MRFYFQLFRLSDFGISFQIRISRRCKTMILHILFCLFFTVNVIGQEKLINYSANNAPLSRVLVDLSDQYGLKFAFDADAFQNTSATFRFENLNEEGVIRKLTSEYPVRFRLLEGTWIAIKNEHEPHSKESESENKEIAVIRNLVSGYVTDAITGEPLAYCNIVTSGQRGTITNQMGYFQTETSASKLQFYISHLGYQRIDTTVAVNQFNPLIIRLQPLVYLMKEVEVARKEKSLVEIGDLTERIGINPSQSASLPRITHDDLVNMLTVIPGVNFLDGPGGGLSIRGGDPSENLILLDGIPLLETGHLLGNISALNASFIRQAFITRGGFDASYGDRASGLIELTGKSGPLSHPTIDVSANLLNTNVVANIPVANKFSLNGGWRKSYINQWKNHLSVNMLQHSRISSTDEQGYEVFPSVSYDDINLKASLFPSDNQIINLGFIQGTDYQMLDYEIGEKQLIYRNERAEALNRGFSGNWSMQFPKWNHTFTVGFSQLEMVRNSESGRQVIVATVNQKPKKNPKANPNPNAGSANRDKFQVDNDSNLVREFRADWKSEIKSGIYTHQFGAGVVDNYFNYYYFAERSLGNDPVDSIARFARQSVAHVFVQQYIEPFRDLKLRWGLRVNYNQRLNQFYFQPRGGIEYLPAEGVKAYYYSGIYRQFLSRIPKMDTYGNLDLIWLLPGTTGEGLLSSQHHVLGVKLEKGGFLMNAELYSRHTSGQQWMFPEKYRTGGINRVRYTLKPGEGNNRGIDFFLQFRHRFFTHQLSWSLADSKQRMQGFNNYEYFPSLNDYRNQLNVNEIFNYKGWILSASWIYRSGQPRMISSENGNIDFDRLDYFSQFDLGVVKTFRFGRVAASGGGSLLNVFNRTNIVGVDYLNISTESGSYSLQSNILSIGITPVFFLRFQVL